jgi:thioester reductase-like protein
VLAGARILLTGATGRLGRCLAEELARSGSEIALVVRAGSPEAARDRARAALAGAVPLRQVTALCGDVTEPGLGLGVRERIRLRASLDVIVHAAATTNFSTPLDVARSVNVAATRNVLTFATRASRLTRLAHVSTAFVAGKRTGRILESDLEHDRGFQNGYQQSKYEAELLVRRYRELLPLVVFRPSIVLDAIEPSAPQRRSAFRFALELVKKGLLPALPGGGNTPVDLVMERDVARAITRLLLLPAEAGTYHVAGGERSPTLASIVEPFGDLRYLGVDQFAWQVSKWRHEKPRLAGLFDELECFIYELAYPKIFDTTCTEAALGGSVTMEDPLASLLDEGPAVGERVQLGARRP